MNGQATNKKPAWHSGVSQTADFSLCGPADVDATQIKLLVLLLFLSLSWLFFLNK